jgi:uncharacterized protein (DUF4415 family)
MARKKTPTPDAENPEWTRSDFARATKFPGGIRLKDLTPAKVRRGRPKLESPKEAIKLRLDAEILDAYRNTGTGWQTRINADLRKALKLKAS